MKSGWWRWPLWSWRNLAVTVMASVMLVACVGRLSGGSERVSPEGRAVEAAARASGAPAPSAPASAASSSQAQSVAPATLESPEEAAVAFVGMWARPDAEVEEWRASCKALSTPGLAAILDAASSAAVPASRVVGDTEILERSALAVEQRRNTLPERVLRDPLKAGASANSPERGSHVVPAAVAAEGVGEDRAFCYAEASPAGLKHREAPPRQHEHSLRGVRPGPRRDETLSLDADDGALHAQGASVKVDVAPSHPERLAEAEAGGEDEAGQLQRTDDRRPARPLEGLDDPGRVPGPARGVARARRSPRVPG